MPARYEYRIFFPQSAAAAADAIAAALASHATANVCETSDDIYIVSRSTLTVNAKLRDGAIELKRLVHRDGNLQLWEPAFEEPLPIVAAAFCRDVLAPLGTTADLPAQTPLAAAEIVDVCAALPVLAVHRVAKQRARFELRQARAEDVRVVIEGHGWWRSLAVESEDADRTRELAQRFGLTSRSNDSYPAFLQGLESTGPEPNRLPTG